MKKPQLVDAGQTPTRASTTTASRTEDGVTIEVKATVERIVAPKDQGQFDMDGPTGQIRASMYGAPQEHVVAIVVEIEVREDTGFANQPVDVHRLRLTGEQARTLGELLAKTMPAMQYGAIPYVPSFT